MKPVIIISAARSGTNILRDLLTRFPGLGTWPCDEINAIWRYRNAGFPNDELPSDLATPDVARYIRSRFTRLAERRGLDHVVEKTCANSLRVDFVDRILPEARYVFLIRDGRDVTASAMKRWVAPPNLAYTLRKGRFVPGISIPGYAARWITNRFAQFADAEGRLGTWGPRFEGIDQCLETHGLAATCARQWARSVQRSEEVCARMDAGRYHRMRFEDLVARPRESIEQLASFLDLRADSALLNAADRMIRVGSVGKGCRSISEEEWREILPHFDGWLGELGYA